MRFLSSLFKDNATRKSDSEKWMETATKEELSAAYEKERKKWLTEGGGDITPQMERLNEEINKRVAEEWENNPKRSRDPNFRWTDANRWDKD